jgi:hypothetical protein
MFEIVFESVKKATEASLRMQQEAFTKWVGLWSGMPGVQNPVTELPQKVQKKWAEFCEEAVKKQRQMLETQFRAGLKNIEEAFKLAEVKDPAELRTKTVELWQKVFEALHHSLEAQVRDFQGIASHWTELMTKGVA